MKKILSKITLFTLLAVMIFTLAACGPNDPNTTDRESVSGETFDVIFDSDGGSTVPNLKNIANGSKINKPSPNPTRPGYAFDGWYNGDKRFNFDEDVVVNNLTLKARWVQDERSFIYHEINYAPDGYKVPDGYTIVCVQDKKTDPNTGKNNWEFYSKYEQRSEHPILVLLKDGSSLETTEKQFYEDDYFVYYYTKSGNEEVRFTTRANKPGKTLDINNRDTAWVKELNNYNYTYGTTIYAKWHSQLPTINIVVKDFSYNLGERAKGLRLYDPITNLEGVIVGKPEVEPDEISPKKDGYEFAGWKFYKENKGWQDLNINNNTSILDDYYLTEDKDSKGQSYTLTIKPNWRKRIDVGSKVDYDNLYTSVTELQALAVGKNASEVTKEGIDGTLQDYCNAKIVINQDIDFTDGYNGAPYRPMFTYEHPFTGEFITGTPGNPTTQKDPMSAPTVRYTLSNMQLSNNGNNISILGVMKGAKVSGLTFKDFTFSYAKEQDDQNYLDPTKYDNINVSVIANLLINDSHIHYCEVVKETNTVAFDFVNAESLTLNYGLLASSSSSSVISYCKVYLGTNVVEQAHNITIQSLGTTKVGTLVGDARNKASIIKDKDNGDIRYCLSSINLTVNVTGNEKPAFIGGLVGSITSSTLSTSKYDGVLTINAHDVALGGLVGYLQESSISDSYSNVNIFVGDTNNNFIKSAKKANVGGLIGEAIRCTNALNHSYASFKSNGIELHTIKGCAVHVAALIGYSKESTLINSFSLVAPIKVNVYEKADSADVINLKNADGSTNKDLLNEILKTVNIGYIIVKTVNLPDTTTKVTNSYYVLAGDFAENIEINGIKHEFYNQTIDGQDPVKKSNFNIKYENYGAKLKEADWTKKTELFDKLLFNQSLDAWNWTFDKDGLNGTTPKLKIEG